MPKDRRSRSVSFDRPSPFSSKNRPPTSPHHSSTDSHQYDEIRCPVCMDHPHNAVLLLCSSHDKGCRPFLCDTSYRHSNCLDQYRRSIHPSILSCPLCRGLVSGSQVLPPARHHLNSKSRSCSTESCPFFGTYSELRKHARTDHPLVRPSDADPERERDWRTLERQRDFGDLISTLQSGFGGEEEGDADLIPFSTITFFLVLRFRRSGGISSSVGWSNGRRSRNWRRGRVLWGESIVDAEDGGDEENDVADGDDDGDDGDDGNNDDGGGEEVNGSSRRRQG